MYKVQLDCVGEEKNVKFLFSWEVKWYHDYNYNDNNSNYYYLIFALWQVLYQCIWFHSYSIKVDILFCKWENCGLMKFTNLPKVRQLGRIHMSWHLCSSLLPTESRVLNHVTATFLLYVSEPQFPPYDMKKNTCT